MKIASFGYDELARKPELKAGDSIPCSRCGGTHEVVENKSAEPSGIMPVNALILHAKDRRLAKVKEEADWSRMCEQCDAKGCVPEGLNGFPHCCPHQWQDGFLLCDGCRERVHPIATFQTEIGDWRGRTHGGSDRCRGPFRPDPDNPGYWKMFGEGMRKKTVLLSFRCGETWFLAGVNGKNVMGG